MENLLKISQVAEAAEISLTTAKYYQREGLIRPVRKTGRNMAYYGPETVERIRLIRKLQAERFYPLAVIRRILDQGAGDAAEAELLRAINRTGAEDDLTPIPLDQAADEAGLPPEQVQVLTEAGLIRPERRNGALWCRRQDLRLMNLARRRLEAGIPVRQTAEVFSLYDRHLRQAARRDMSLLLRDAMLSPTLTAREALEIINVSDETMDQFIAMRRYALNAEAGGQLLARVERFLAQLERFGRELLRRLPPDTPLLDQLAEVLDGGAAADPLLSCFGELLGLRSRGIADALSALHRARSLFAEERGAPLVRRALGCAAAVLAPEELGFPTPAPNYDLPQSLLALLEEIQSEKEMQP